VIAACLLLPDGRRRRLACVTGIVVLAAALGVTAAAAPLQIPVRGELALCAGQPVAPVDGVLHLGAACALTLQIEWLQALKQAYVEFSADGGATWQKDPLPLVFPAVSAGSVSGIGFGACDVLLPTGTYLLRAHGFLSPVERGSVYSAPFPAQVALDCG
jgi:hypothetical protein